MGNQLISRRGFSCPRNGDKNQGNIV